MCDVKDRHRLRTATKGADSHAVVVHHQEVAGGGHGGSHGYLGDEFVTAILEDRKPLVNIAWALNMSVAGVVAHQSALKDGELLKIPQYHF